MSTALGLFARGNPVTRLGIVCVDAVNGAPALPTWISPEGFGLVPEAIQTGFVISRECLETVGLFDERLVIDCVDTEYCLRVRDHGFRIAVARGTDIRHSIGRRAELRPFGVPLRHRESGRIATYQYHSPFRRYYIARNNIDLILRNLTRRPRWVLAVLKREMGGMIVSMVSGPQRVAQVLAITTGTVHGLFRRRGMIPGWLKALIDLDPALTTRLPRATRDALLVGEVDAGPVVEPVPAREVVRGVHDEPAQSLGEAVVAIAEDPPGVHERSPHRAQHRRRSGVPRNGLAHAAQSEGLVEHPRRVLAHAHVVRVPDRSSAARTPCGSPPRARPGRRRRPRSTARRGAG